MVGASGILPRKVRKAGSGQSVTCWFVDYDTVDRARTTKELFDSNKPLVLGLVFFCVDIIDITILINITYFLT